MNFEVEKIHKDILTRVRAGEPFYNIVCEMFEDDPDMRDHITRTEYKEVLTPIRNVYTIHFNNGNEASIIRWYGAHLNDDSAVTIWYTDPTGTSHTPARYSTRKSQS